jgi:hypothetical protein
LKTYKFPSQTPSFDYSRIGVYKTDIYIFGGSTSNMKLIKAPFNELEILLTLGAYITMTVETNLSLIDKAYTVSDSQFGISGGTPDS